MRERTCHQEGCTLPPHYRYTWPGREEQVICVIHGVQVAGLANAIGLQLQLIVLTLDDHIRLMNEDDDNPA